MFRGRIIFSAAAAAFILAAPAQAAVTATNDPVELSAAMGWPPTPAYPSSWVTTVGATPHGTANAPLAGFPTDGTTFGIMTTGDVTKADQPGTFADTQNGGLAVRGDTDRDVSILKLDFTTPEGANCLTFEFKFLSEEYPQFVTSNYNDTFIAELDESNWTTQQAAINAPRNFAFGPDGNVISIKSTGVANMNAENAAGTPYGGATTLLRASTAIGPGAHSLYLSILDQSDQRYDTAVFIDKLQATTVGDTGCKSGASSGTEPPVANDPPPPPPAPAPAPAPAPKPAPKPTAFGVNGIVSAPSPKKCLSRRNFRIRIRKRTGIKYETAIIFVNGKRVVTRRGSRITAPIDLRGLPKGRYTVKITVITSTGNIIAGTRKYRTCARKKSGGRRGPL